MEIFQPQAKTSSMALLALLLWGCATGDPEGAARRELLIQAAQQCQRQYPFVSRFEFDRFSQLNWFYRETASPSERDQFRACYRDRVSESVKAQAAAPSSASRPAASSTAVIPPNSWASPPDWKIGDEWSYQWRSSRGSGTFLRKVVSEETVDGIECYVVTSGRYYLYFRKTDLAWMLQKESGVITYKYTPPRQEAVWPLHVERSWEQLYVQDQPERRQTDNYLRIARVELRERITVPAGTFDTYKVVVRNKYNNALVRIYWLGPDVKNVVRREEYYDYGVENQDLTAFKLN